MRVNLFPCVIAAAVSALLAYGLFTLCKTNGQEALLAIGGFVCMFVTLAVGVAVRFDQGRTSANTAVLGWLFFIVMLISHAIFAFVHFATPGYVIVNGILLLLFVGVTYGVAKAKQ
ncbi:MAG: hypothetical protein IJM88_02770 [Bacteroidales bacterium]|nr:hypothetical protein [Bacteroidales bacterium]